MGKYRLVRMNEVRYTDDEHTLELWLDEGFVLEPEFEPDTEPTDGEGKKTTKSSKKQS